MVIEVDVDVWTCTTLFLIYYGTNLKHLIKIYGVS
jgi:hypothetical protein